MNLEFTLSSDNQLAVLRVFGSQPFDLIAFSLCCEELAVERCLRDLYDHAVKVIESKRLEKQTHNKAIQKAVESFRVSEEHKKYLKSLKY